MRCDANISIRPVGSTTLGTKTEIKNINSFSAVQKGIEYEAVRQAQILEEGGTIQQATRGWDEAKALPSSSVSKKGTATTVTSRNRTSFLSKSRRLISKKSEKNCRKCRTLAASVPGRIGSLGIRC